MNPDNIELDRCFLCDLPLDVLRTLLSYLDATSLYILSQTCTYLKECVEDPSLWKYINSLSPPHNLEKFLYCMDRVFERTSHLLLGSSGCTLPLEFFPIIKPFQNLKILALENQSINGHKVSMNNFPSSLEELSLRGAKVKANKLSFFHLSWANFPKLRVLILDNCKWATSSVLMSLSKYPSLEILSIVKCVKIHGNTLPYLAIAKYGFKKLKVLDCRFTGIGQMVLYTFYSIESIQRLYFQSFNAANLDYDQNFSETLGRVRYSAVDMSLNITDASLHDYGSVICKNDFEKVCNSELYLDPYPNCTCGYQNLTTTPNASDWPVVEDDIIDSRCGTLKMICKQHRKGDPSTKPPHLRHLFFSAQNDDDDDDDSAYSGSDDEVCCLYGREATVVLMEPLNRDASNNVNIPSSRPLFIRVRTVNDEPDATPSTSRGCTSGAETSASNSSKTRAASEATSSQNHQTNNRPQERREKRKSSPSDNDSDDLDYEPPKRPRLNERESDSFLNSDTIQRVEQLVQTADAAARRINNLLNDNSHNALYLRSFEHFIRDRQLNRAPSGAHRANNFSRNPNVVCVNFHDDPVEDQLSPPVNQELQLQHFDRHMYRNQLPSRFRWLENRVRPPLEKRSSLNRLSLRGYRKITDRGLEYLKHLNMELLDLTYTTVTKEGIENFLVNNPNCRIIHPLYCVCKPRKPC